MAKKYIVNYKLYEVEQKFYLFLFVIRLYIILLELIRYFTRKILPLLYLLTDYIKFYIYYSDIFNKM